MADLINFVTLLNGKFDNKDQFEKISKTNPQYPYAKHINTICNSKIANLPNGFEGVFMIEESYYSVQGTIRSSSHHGKIRLFLRDPCNAALSGRLFI